MATPTSGPVVNYTLDDYFQTTNIGSIERVVGNNLYGIRHSFGAAPVPVNKDMYGFTFFTRPQLNMQGDNLRNVRTMYTLLSQNSMSIPRWVRCTLDPRLMYGYGSDDLVISNPLNCLLVDNEQAFIPVLTNNLQSISGWPDMVTSAFVSKAGIYGESYAMVDGHYRNYGDFDMDATFKNTKGDPISYLFQTWCSYQSLVFEGMLLPYPDFITENELDYNTRIYRLVMDNEMLYVKKIAATGASFPMNLPTGQFFDYSSEKPYNDQSKDITIRFKCLGAIFNDDILIKEFNDTVVIFNNAMHNDIRDRDMIMVPRKFLPIFNNRGYARINPDNYMLEWWVSKDLYNSKLNALTGANLDITAAQPQV